jgi:hypothetical protein
MALASSLSKQTRGCSRVTVMMLLDLFAPSFVRGRPRTYARVSFVAIDQRRVVDQAS